MLFHFASLHPVGYCLRYVVLYAFFQPVNNPEIAALVCRPAQVDLNSLCRPGAYCLSAFKVRNELCKRIWMVVEYQVLCQPFMPFVDLGVRDDVACVDNDGVKAGLE